MNPDSLESELQKIIQIRLKETLGALYAGISDRSELHRGHAGARSGGGHFDLVVVSAVFEGVGLLERHRLVYQALGDLFKEHMHALALKALTPEEWERQRLGSVPQTIAGDEESHKGR